MQNLFYSENEKLAFWVSGYDISSNNVQEIMQYLIKTSAKACDLLNISVFKLETIIVSESRRYKYMRVFYAKVNKMPDNAFIISDENGWTMHKWLSD
jgi:hypothetical protein